jgi:hypothetical protein
MLVDLEVFEQHEIYVLSMISSHLTLHQENKLL